MKKLLYLILPLAFLVSCTGGKQKIELKLAPGETYILKTVGISTIQQSYGGQDMEITLTISGQISYKVKELIDSVYTMVVSYDSLSMKMQMPFMEMEFSTAKDDEEDVFSMVMKALVGKPFGIKMTTSGRIMEVTGIEEMFASMFDQFPQLSPEEKQQIFEQLEQSYGESALQNNLGMTAAFFPYVPVKKGDKWNISTQMTTGFNATMESVYELMDVKGGYYLINGEATIVSDTTEAQAGMAGIPMSYKLTGTMSSAMKIDRKTGWIIESDIQQNISGSVSVADSEQMPGGMEIPMSTKLEMTITGK
ncbi:MAG: DUF6263 family protein [Bacteroidota bacterium]